MSATYNPKHTLERDRIRALIGDTSEESAQLQDEEIDAWTARELQPEGAREFYVAARCLDVLAARYSTAGRGLSSKSIGRLSKSWGGAGTVQALRDRARELRVEGSMLVSTGGASFHMRIL